MTDQLAMTVMLGVMDDDYHRHRAVKPSWLEPCEGCDGQALVSEGVPRPWLCENCKVEKRNER